MSIKQNRQLVLDRISRELIGPGSDIFCSKEDYSDEVIEGKPLQRYFSGILFPKQEHTGEDDEPKTYNDEDVGDNPELDESNNDLEDPNEDAGIGKPKNEETPPKYVSNTFYPSHFGITFAINDSCERFNVSIRFGNYFDAEPEDIKLSYEGEGVEKLEEYGLNHFLEYDAEEKTLRQIKKLQRKRDNKNTLEYQSFLNGMAALKKDTSYNHSLVKAIYKLFYKEKYKRNDNHIEFEISVSDILSTEKNHLVLKLSEQENVHTETWHKELVENLVFHLKLYDNYEDKYYIKAVLENKASIRKGQFTLSKEKVNHLACFQTEIKIESNSFLPFRDYKSHLYKTAEDRMLDYLYRDKLAFGAGHNTACTWENAGSDNTPSWVKSTFLPEYDVRSQSATTDKVEGDVLNIKNLSVFNKDKSSIISNLREVEAAYNDWIEDERITADGNELGLQNIAKCEEIHSRIDNGIRLLSEDEDAMRAFQLANTAIYLQFFQGEKHFNGKKKEGYEVWERTKKLQYPFEEYATLDYPSNRIPEWRPFQLAFILQCLPSFIDENSPDKELVDLLYFPTGGGKTEAYLAVSAFLIFWRRIKYPDSYDGVNIIIRYTLRLLSAQQFERASKLILACEFIRSSHRDLGDKRISIGFWVGDSTIPNKRDKANIKLNDVQKRLNQGNQYAVNPFQLSTCQWCNSKIISKRQEEATKYAIGHNMMGGSLNSYCLNEDCLFAEQKGGFPIVLVDEDIYENPPTILFATVDKFAQIAWKGASGKFFNNRNNRKPELIIQDELHLLNGTLGSMVGLFENVLMELCDYPKIIASTATVKNVEKQIEGLYSRDTRVFPQYATNADDTFFSRIIDESKRKYVGLLPTGKTTVVTNLQLLASLFYARLEVWQNAEDKTQADAFWTILSYFKSLKEIGRFSNKINAELKPIVKQLQVRHLQNNDPATHNYYKLSYRNIELTSRIPNERIKGNLDKLEIQFDGNIKEHKAYDLVLATNMISVGLDVGRLGIMVMNGMPPNTAEYIQASSRVARKNEGLVITLYDPFNSRDLSYYEDFVQFHKTFYKQVEPLSVTPFAENALDKMLFTLIVAYFRHTTQYTNNQYASIMIDNDVKNKLREDLLKLFKNHRFYQKNMDLIIEKVDDILDTWQSRVENNNDISFYLPRKPKQSLMTPSHERTDIETPLRAMQSMRNVEPSAQIAIKQY